MSVQPLDPYAQLRSALHASLGVGHGVGEEHAQKLQAKLTSTWKSLPKNKHGNIDHRSLCYIVHRYFLQTYSIAISGLESGPSNSSRDEIKLLSDYAPNYVRSQLEGDAALDGFTIEDIVAMVMMIEHLISDSGRELLEGLFSKVDGDVSLDELMKIMERYLAHWMLSADGASIRALERKPELINKTFENWGDLAKLARGSTRSYVHLSLMATGSATGPAQAPAVNPLKQSFSVEDAVAVAGDMTTSFGSYWSSECLAVKESLKKLDTGSTGRVKLAKFHSAALDGEWRFSESKEYLRALGALDESSSWHGPQLIIPNYLQSVSNCIVTMPHYRVCCSNECEGYMDALEAAVGAPTAAPEELLRLVGEIAIVEADDGATFPASLRSQLFSIAAQHGGSVPLHGRLFAQWLHYAFPHECPFPHLGYVTETRSPLEYGRKSMATRQEMISHASVLKQRSRNDTASDAEVSEDWMTLWSHEEELLSETLNLQAPWEAPGSQILKVAGGLALAAISLLCARYRFTEVRGKMAGMHCMLESKSHFV